MNNHGITTGDVSIDAWQVVALIEQSLAAEAIVEQARWYLLSVLCCQTDAPMLDPDRCAISRSRQLPLARDLLEIPGARKSLELILRYKIFRYRLMGFAEKPDRKKQLLSRTTRLFEHASGLLSQELRLTSSPEERAPLSIVTRRASRRRIQEVAQLPLIPIATQAVMHAQVQMSAEEYARLEQAILTPVDARQLRKTTYKTLDYKLSLLAGLVSGGLLFTVFWWLFF